MRFMRPRRSLVLACAVWAALAVACSSDDAQPSSQPEPSEWLPGGDGTNTLLLGVNAFTKPASNITADHEASFFTGNSYFNQPWVQAPSSTETRDGLGPLFNARSCASCHFKDGRGKPPLDSSEPFEGLLLRISVPGADAHGAPLPDPQYGGQLQPFGVLGVPPEARPTVTYEEAGGAYADGEPYSLQIPRYELHDLAHGPLAPDAMLSPRVAPAMAGLGLLEAITLERLQQLEDPDDQNGDGISGRLNWVWDVTAGAPAPGRFGWKAEQPSVRQQSAGAFVGDIGITSSLFPEQDCMPSDAACLAAHSGGAPEIPDHLFDRVEIYSLLLAVPVRERYDDELVLRGKALFSEIGCGGCHVSRHETGEKAGFPELSGQEIWPYTDLLLHDMGPELSDSRPSFGAVGAEWRTPPLWGLRFYRIVNGHDRLLHDGRARGVAEAILWHGGEAESARESFKTLAAADRRALIEFVESL